MVKVIKKSKELEVFNPKKIMKACVKAGVPKEIAKVIPTIVKKKIKGKKKVSSKTIRNIVLGTLEKCWKSIKKWKKYERKH